MSDNKPKKKRPPYALRKKKAIVSAKAKKAAKGSPIKNLEDRTPTQLAQLERRGPVPENMAPNPYVGNKFAIGNKGRPSAYETPEELEWWCRAYFEWIKGEFIIKQIERKKPGSRKKEIVEVKEWVRPPEFALRTGLVLFLGLCSHTALIDLEEKSPEFANVVRRARALVEMGYETDLRNRDAANGSKFALSNMGWKNTQNVQALGKDGKPVDPASPAVINVTTLAENLGKV